MTDEWDDARLAELEFLSELSREAGRALDEEIRTPGPQRDMIAFLVDQRYVNHLSIPWRHDDMDSRFGGLAGESELERQLHRESMVTLSRVLGGQPVSVRISHRGRVRIAELRQELQKGRIREGFGILWDKRHLETDLRIVLLRASGERPLSLAFIDMNGLKSINDGISHDAGDAAIRAYFHAAEALLGVRGDVYCAGGDEVVAILPDCDGDQAFTALRAMCQSLMGERIRIGGKDLPVLTVSAGVATVTTPATRPDEMRRRADEAMYRGKDKARSADPRPCSIADSDGRVEMLGPSAA